MTRAVNNSIKRLNSQKDHPDLSSIVVVSLPCRLKEQKNLFFSMTISPNLTLQSPECSFFFLGLHTHLKTLQEGKKSAI